MPAYITQLSIFISSSLDPDRAASASPCLFSLTMAPRADLVLRVIRLLDEALLDLVGSLVSMLAGLAG